jgi:hypothetical protein
MEALRHLFCGNSVPHLCLSLSEFLAVYVPVPAAGVEPAAAMGAVGGPASSTRLQDSGPHFCDPADLFASSSDCESRALQLARCVLQASCVDDSDLPVRVVHWAPEFGAAVLASSDPFDAGELAISVIGLDGWRFCVASDWTHTAECRSVPALC